MATQGLPAGELSEGYDSPVTTNGRNILAHLGDGTSLAAVRDGKCIDTSMAITPAAGLIMGRRSGDLDPGLAAYLASTEGMRTQQFHELVKPPVRASGRVRKQFGHARIARLGELRHTGCRSSGAVLLSNETVDWLICCRARRIGHAGFSGGISENSPVNRARICDGLGFLGLEVNESRNAENAALISAKAGRVAVRVIRTDEELMIASSVCRALGLGAANKTN